MAASPKRGCVGSIITVSDITVVSVPVIDSTVTVSAMNFVLSSE
jgi:hypothetical protein